MIVTSSPCAVCGYLVPFVSIATVTVNKRSLRQKSAFLAAMFWSCPECAEPVWPGGSVPVSAYRLDAESTVKVMAYRARRWPERTA